MLKTSLCAFAITLAIGLSTARGEDPKIGHMVFFTLKDPTDANKKQMVEACKKYLKKHDGVEYFSAGVNDEKFKEPVNDREFHIALHLVFKDKASMDKYLPHPDHIKFIDENKALWAKVRVFDSEIK